MLQGAVVALVLAGVAGLLGFAGVGGAESHEAACAFLLVGTVLVAAFLGMAWLRRATAPTGSLKGVRK